MLGVGVRGLPFFLPKRVEMAVSPFSSRFFRTGSGGLFRLPAALRCVPSWPVRQEWTPLAVDQQPGPFFFLFSRRSASVRFFLSPCKQNSAFLSLHSSVRGGGGGGFFSFCGGGGGVGGGWGGVFFFLGGWGGVWGGGGVFFCQKKQTKTKKKKNFFWGGGDIRSWR